MKSQKLLRLGLFGITLFLVVAPALFTSSAQLGVQPTGASTSTQLPGKIPTAAKADAVVIAEQHVRGNLTSLGLTTDDIAEWRVSDRYSTAHNGVTHVYFLQRLGGVEVLNGIMNVNVARDGRVINVGSRFIPHLSEVANTSVPQITAEQAVRASAANLGIEVNQAPSVQSIVGGLMQEVVFIGAPLSLKPIKVRLQYLKVGQGARLVWDVQIQPDSNHYWHVEVDAVDSTIHRKFNLVKSDSYKVYEWPAESPNHVGGLPVPPADGRTVVTGSAANLTASPFGWHDTNGLAGADTADTTGNNVAAQTDETNDDVYVAALGEVRPSDVGRNFIFPIDLTQEPTTYREAVVTNLFYWNNVIHDIHYLYGFDEAAGNFQQNNYGKGGQGNDRVDADAQDGSGKNNANMLTLPEGAPPRMQMYLWAGEPVLTVNTPASIAGNYPSAAAAFGEALDATGVTGDIQHIVSPGPNPGPQGELPEHGCFPAPGTLTGMIALIKRGGCEFGQKVVSAEQSGAIAAIIYNHEVGGDELVFMGPGNMGAAATIPSIFIGLTNGTTLKNTDVTTNVNVTMKKASVDRDSDLDNGVIIHEYGHGVSIRLTGGPSNVLCLENLEQGGEGWSDWWALALTARASDEGTDPRGIGTYVTFQDPPTFGGGIRLFPYSTDMTVNPQTYESLKDVEVTVPHGVGAVWAQMIWEMYWNIVDGVPALGLPGHGFRQNIQDMSTPLAGNQIAMRLVMDGLKLQPCMPTFVEARDAILEADRVNNGGAFQCHIWTGFAKRGLGVNAQDGGKFPLDDHTAVVEDFTVPCECSLPSLTNFAASANGATATASSFHPDRNYMPSGAIDGDAIGVNWENNGGWNDGTRDQWPDSLEVAFNGSQTINQIRVYTLQNNFKSPTTPTPEMTCELYGLIDFDVQTWDGSAWVTVPGGEIRGNTLVLRPLFFTPVTTTKIRINVLNARSHYSRVVEVEAFGCSP
jgi:extracellular elastinolytic metalloproteinase